MDLELLRERLAERGEPRFRAGQVWSWAARGAGSYAEMTDLPLSLRDALAAEVPFSSLALETEASASDGTRKALLRTQDGRPVEAVLMSYRDGRRSLCLSSQSGCPLTCTFCATGAMRFGRNLAASEILDQALHFRRPRRARRDIESRPSMTTGAIPAPVNERRDGRSRPSTATGAVPAAVNERGSGPLSHAVFMGMGEPLMNLDAVLAACERLPDLGIATGSTAISTVGWLPGIERLAREGPPVRLALSLHAADEALRSELMPVNERYPLCDVLDACRAWHAARRREVFVEYLMLGGVNDRVEQAQALAGVLGPRHAFKVNLIPYNPTGSGFRGSTREAIAAFKAVLERRGVRTTVRLTRGRDIDAACGQLAARSRAQPGQPALRR